MTMEVIYNPSPEKWKNYTRRPAAAAEVPDALITRIFEEVRDNGDAALFEYTLYYDKAALSELKVPESRFEAAEKQLPAQLKEAIRTASSNISTFHRAQVEKPVETETSKGIICRRESRPVERVGLYIPGGSAPLFSTVLMLGIPAKIAGCPDVYICTPPDSSGNIHPAILYAAQSAGVNTVFKVGGIQAVAAMTFGTETISAADKIFGPGNSFVTAAKLRAQQLGKAIDLPAGPSELLVIADEQANPVFVAADLLAQAEHGADSQVILLCTAAETAAEVRKEVSRQLGPLPRKKIAEEALKNSRIIVLNTISECLAFSNAYAPEHLILAVEHAGNYTAHINNAGSVFLGGYSSESFGDYASGTNHTLPTGGYARMYSGVSTDSFVKKITFQNITAEGVLELGPAVELMAEAEGLQAHKNAVTVRINQILKQRKKNND